MNNFPLTFFFTATILLIANHVPVSQGLFFNQLVFATSTTTTTVTTTTATPALPAEEEVDTTRTLSFPTNPTGNFNAAGSISSLLINNGSQNPQYVLAGNWSLLASEGNITDFRASFTMVSIDGKQRHIHSITNFSSNVVAPLILNIHGPTFTGESDITTNGNVTWHAVQTTVTIAQHDVIRITLDEANARNHFQNQAIYGIVFSVDENESSS